MFGQPGPRRRAADGACAAAGSRVCAADGAGTICGAVPGEPAAETCNGLDDDCDGTVDNGFDPGAACESGVGACVRAGDRVCTADGAGTECGAVSGAPTAETCNGLDDDCDGFVDDGFDTGAGCTVGEGLCARDGARVCAADGSGTVCDATPGAPAVEQCNGLDDDCDGTLDEDFTDLDDVCTAGLGLCPRPAT